MIKLMMISIVSMLLLIGCGTTETEEPQVEEESEPPVEETEESTDDLEDEDTDTSEEDEAEIYQEENYTQSIVPIVEWLWYDQDDLLAFRLHVTEDDLTTEERMKQSFIESDVTIQESFDELVDVTIDDDTATLTFTDEHELASLASTEQMHLTETLEVISSLYKITELNFYVDDQAGIDYGQTGQVESMSIETDSNRGYYLVTDEELLEGSETRTYLPSFKLDSEIDSNADLYETITAMSEVPDASFDLDSAIPSEVMIQEVETEGERVEVYYEISDETKRDDLIETLALTLMDFAFNELHLIDDSNQLTTIVNLN
ncbi:Uncharacterized conserved protein YgiM, contains N-terminal SH3 domain, DUF1202 family [Pelagirhabdus alkalitolerans]|uniref:Uncharacterized conserved protein YgiM, contains N-terminal SH3 domain, DUF1202 family n=1 Tax=Pelagirhabdus alkalitolerans TaxID=1612202 RepID=A0A1G6JVG6_9BACI|nr:hypothetical protein [Pelagirhabdus alkalitolerans]SDC22658.1 Uncharacterized conserved protein YgiM, contains N-terminal SH3 domain, DUF1202 family [Pelagirhabdus alkalitolerans]